MGVLVNILGFYEHVWLWVDRKHDDDDDDGGGGGGGGEDDDDGDDDESTDLGICNFQTNPE